MYIVPIAWIYVAMMMAVVEATSTTGTVLGAAITFLLYGLMPVGLVVYLMGSPARKTARRHREAVDDALAQTMLTEQAFPTDVALEVPQAEVSAQPDASGHAPASTQGDAVAPVRKEL